MRLYPCLAYILLSYGPLYKNSQILEFHVQSNPGADGSGSVAVVNETVFRGSFLAQYESVQVSAALGPSICEVYFVISNLQVRMLFRKRDCTND